MNFSVAMCVYAGDNPFYFEQSLKSILENTLQPNEITLVVDGPVSDEHEKVISKYKDVLTVFRFKSNQGHGNARRKSLELCKNELIAIMDADDICLKDRFEKQIVVFENDNTLSVVGGQIEEFIDDLTNIVSKREVPLYDEEIKVYLKKRCPMNLMTVMLKKKDILSVGGFIDWYCEEDYYLWIRMTLNNLKFRNLNDTLVYVRVGKEMYQRRGGLKYFKSEAKLQKIMFQNKMISLPVYLENVIKRLIVQVLLPNKIRGWVFRKFARTNP